MTYKRWFVFVWTRAVSDEKLICKTKPFQISKLDQIDKSSSNAGNEAHIKLMSIRMLVESINRRMHIRCIKRGKAEKKRRLRKEKENKAVFRE